MKKPKDTSHAEAHRLDLIGNAVDSLDESLTKYVEGVEGDKKAFKFCILHLVHFVELYFKHCVSLRHQLLVLRNPWGPLKDAFTIDVYQAIQILKNDGVHIEPDLERDIRWLKRLRNDIEHREFTMDLEEVDNCIGRLIYAVHTYDEQNDWVDLRKHLSEPTKETYDRFAERFFERMKIAQHKIKAAEEAAYAGYRPKEFGLVRFSITSCPHCGNETVIPDGESTTGYTCQFCGEADVDEDEVESDCDRCGTAWPMSDLRRIQMEGDFVEALCPYCRHDPAYVKDD